MFFGRFWVYTESIFLGVYISDPALEEERTQREHLRKLLILRCSELFDGLPLDDDGNANRADVIAILPAVEKLFEDGGIQFTHFEFEGMLDMAAVRNLSNWHKPFFLPVKPVVVFQS